MDSKAQSTLVVGCIATTLVLGLRRGEALGLSWGDIDQERNQIRIRQSLQRLDGPCSSWKPRPSHPRPHSPYRQA